MPWFYVDDNLAFHPKVIEAGNCAMGLWVRCGAWSTSALTDGYVPLHIATQMGTQKQIATLVDTTLWIVDDSGASGYHFHDWATRQITKAEVEARRSYERERKAEQRKRNRTQQTLSQGTVPVGLPRDSRARLGQAPVDTSTLGLGSNGHVPNVRDAASAEAARADPWIAIADCSLCDDDGYRNNSVCDHVDRELINAHGRKTINETMNWKQ